MKVISGSGGCCTPRTDIISMIENVESIAVNALTVSDQTLQYIQDLGYRHIEATDVEITES